LASGQIEGEVKNEAGEVLWLDEPVKGINCSKARRTGA
jgi:hypothetical protein